MKWFDLDPNRMYCDTGDKFYVPGLTSNKELETSIKIILSAALWKAKTEICFGKHGKIILEYDEPPNPTVFIVNYIYTTPIDMVEISFNKNNQEKLKYRYIRSFNPYTHCFPFIEEKIRFLNSKLINWNEFGGRLKARIIELI